MSFSTIIKITTITTPQIRKINNSFVVDFYEYNNDNFCNRWFRTFENFNSLKEAQIFLFSISKSNQLIKSLSDDLSIDFELINKKWNGIEKSRFQNNERNISKSEPKSFRIYRN